MRRVTCTVSVGPMLMVLAHLRHQTAAPCASWTSATQQPSWQLVHTTFSPPSTQACGAGSKTVRCSSSRTPQGLPLDAIRASLL